MKIDDYSINMSSSHDLTQYSKKEETLVQWVGDEDDQKSAYLNPVKVNLSPEALESLKNKGEATSQENPVDLTLSSDALKKMIPKIEPVKKDDDNPYISEEDKLKIQIIEKLFYLVTGKKIEIRTMSKDDVKNTPEESEKISSDLQGKIFGTPTPSDEPERVGWGLDYHYKEEHYESEKMTFNAQGMVKTVDGREIHLDAALSMSREFISSKELSIKAGDALIDPLVINFSGNPAQLDDNMKVEFDLDMDGNNDQLAYLTPGSGYLALDKNEDGNINNGRELFGPSTGNGFDELAQYDEDGNGWIDENDSIYDKLRVWNKTPDGEETLLALGQTGVGAIYLGSASTKFSLTDGLDGLNGQLKESGIYLNENGTVGTIQELDLAI